MGFQREDGLLRTPFKVAKENLKIDVAVTDGHMIVPLAVIVVEVNLCQKRAQVIEPILHSGGREGVHVAGVKTKPHLPSREGL